VISGAGAFNFRAPDREGKPHCALFASQSCDAWTALLPVDMTDFRSAVAHISRDDQPVF
jgi:hypothetical protein